MPSAAHTPPAHPLFCCHSLLYAHSSESCSGIKVQEELGEGIACHLFCCCRCYFCMVMSSWNSVSVCPVVGYICRAVN